MASIDKNQAKAFITDPEYVAFLQQDLKEKPKDAEGFDIPEKPSTHDRLRVIANHLAKAKADLELQKKRADLEKARVGGRKTDGEVVESDDESDSDDDSAEDLVESDVSYEDSSYEDDPSDEDGPEPAPIVEGETPKSLFAEIFGSEPPKPIENGAKSQVLLKKGMSDDMHLNFIKNVHKQLTEKPHSAVRIGIEGFKKQSKKSHFSLIPEAKEVFKKSFLLGMGGCLIFHGFVGEATTLFCYAFAEVTGQDKKIINYSVDELVLGKALKASSQVFLKTQMNDAMVASKIFTQKVPVAAPRTSKNARRKATRK